MPENGDYGGGEAKAFWTNMRVMRIVREDGNDLWIGKWEGGRVNVRRGGSEVNANRGFVMED